MKNILTAFICISILMSCDYFTRKSPEKAIARVNELYLYEEDVKDLLTEAKSKEDSAFIVNNFITRWATQQLLIEGAERNISNEDQLEFNKLVDQYRK